MDDTTKKAFVIGWPISHSLSPQLHTYWLEHNRINGTYEKISLPPEELQDFLKALPYSDFAGGNITIPHKERAYEIIAPNDKSLVQLEAVNTVWVENGNLQAANTDGYGFTANLDDFHPTWRNVKTATVLGAGGASKAIAFALQNAGIERITIVNRTKQRAELLAMNLGANCNAQKMSELPAILENTDLLINTTSLGMRGQPALEINLKNMPKTAIVTDIVYNPLLTPLLEQAKSLGLVAIDGIGMLLHQAVPGFEKWFGIRPEVTTELREHVLGILKAAKS